MSRLPKLAVAGTGANRAVSAKPAARNIVVEADAPSKTLSLRGCRASSRRTTQGDPLLSTSSSGIPERRRREQAPRAGGERGYGRFELGFVRESLERSSAALRTDRLGAVLLHEPRLSDPPAETRDLLESMVSRHAIGQLGAGTARGSAELPRFGSLAQCTVEASLPTDGREWIVHGLMRDFDPDALQAALACSGLVPAIPSLQRFMSTEQRGASVLLCAVLVGAAPSRVLLSTHSPSRLRTLLAEGAELFGELQGLPSARAPLGQLVRDYLAGRRGAS